MRSAVALAFCALMLPIIPTVSAATQPNPSQRERELVEEMMQVTHAKETLKQTMDAMLGQMQKTMLDQAKNGDPAAAEEARIRFERFRQLVGEKVNFDEDMRSIYTTLYVRYFTDDELAQMVAFYKSPVGQKMISVLPQLMADSMKLSTDEYGPVFESLFAQVERERQQAKPWLRTMADIRTIATAVEAWSEDHEGYPRAADWSALRKELEPDYVKQLPSKDVWENAYSYTVSADGQHYRVVSSGADGIFEWDSRQPAAPAKDAKMRVSDRLEDDIIYGDGQFLQVPKVSQPAP